MIKYRSTRGEDSRSYSFSQSLLKGIAADNGLLCPEKIPFISPPELISLVGKSYQDIALFVFKKFATDFSEEVLKKVIYKAYGKKFSDPGITPVIKLNKDYFVMELWHGPTAAFKDLALQIMPLLFLESIQTNKQKKKYLVLAATSGDTGKAALEGYKNLENISILVLYPKNKVSRLQELQMITQSGNNICVLAVDGDFDQSQSLVKEILADEQFNDQLNKQFNTKLTSANSINWGRLIPQIIYYFVGYMNLIQQKVLKLGDEINVSVPTGNFGNILAAFLSKKMGLPIDKLICATNENNAVSEFLNTGIYDISHKSMKSTLSPAMDILVASNIERLLFFITKDPTRVAGWMNQLKVNKKFKVDTFTLEILQKNFKSTWVSNKETSETIKNNYLQNNYLMDPHTSIAVAAADRFSEKFLNIPVLIDSTAHWSKFPAAIYQSLGLKPQNSNEFEMLAKISKLQYVSKIPDSIKKLQENNIRFKKIISPNLNDLGRSILTHLSNVKT